MLWHKYLELLFTQGLEKFEKWEKFEKLKKNFIHLPFYGCKSLSIAHFIKPYRDLVHFVTGSRKGFMKWTGPFHKTLPRPIAFWNWISVRFYETGWSQNGRRLKTSRMVSVLNSDPLSFKEKVWTPSSDLNWKVSDISSYFFLSGLLPRTSHVQW